MPDTPWMASMLGQLLDAIESDPALLARLRRLLAPPIAASPPPAEPSEVEWVGELTPADLRGRGSPHVHPASSFTSPSAAPPTAPTRPVVLPPPAVRGKAKADGKPVVAQPPPAKPVAPAAAPGRPISAAIARKPAPVPAAEKAARPTPTRPKPVTVSTAALRAAAAAAAPPPARPTALPEPPVTVAPFVLSWLPQTSAENELPTTAVQHPLADALQVPWGAAPMRRACRLPADLLQTAGRKTPRPERPEWLQNATRSPHPPSEMTTGRRATDHASERRGEADATEAPSDERERAAELLAGRTAVMIGGVCRPDKQESLRRELGLRELRWIGTRVHGPLEPLLTAISDPDVGLVLLLIKLSSHSYGELAEPCKRRGIPLVRIPGGWGTNQIAHQILDQAGARLAALPAA
ncbi:MAG: hypothetical protein MUE46_06180 [Xanthomonadales bacterium]|jgi:hypothetical protein|nr:hypothetical protein [Xanthomonadales bacterium]